MLAVTEIKRDSPNLGLTTPIPVEDAFLVALQVREVVDHELWLDGRSVYAAPLPAGTTTIYDLRRNPIAYVGSPFHSLHFYLPRPTINAMAEEEGVPAIDDLKYELGDCGKHDAVLRLGNALLPAFEQPNQANRLFVDHVCMALCAHVICAFGGYERGQLSHARGGLSPRQERIAKEIMHSNLDGEVPLEELARACGLSIGHFARAFRNTTGLPPHRWLLQRRLEKAKQEMCNTDASLADIALECGFADQSHFTRVFARAFGSSPGAWRRQHR